MGHAMTNALAVFLLCLAAATAVPAHFPHGKTVVYKYYADVKAGAMEPAPFASQFAIDGLLHVMHDTTDPTLKNAYQVTLTDVKYALHNGQAHHHERLDATHPIMEAATPIQDPFLIVFDENGKFQGMKMMEKESGWSRNMKQAIGSMLQLDLSKIHVQTPMKPHAFITTENTIHGICTVAYDVHAKDQVHPESSNVFVVTKIHEPESCTHFVQHTMNHVDADDCHVQPEDDMTTATRRVFEIEHQGNDILIKKLIGHGVINYIPYLAKSDAHYLLTNQTLTLQDVVEAAMPTQIFQDVQMIRDVTFKKPQDTYALLGDEDLTQGRHTIKTDVLIPKLKKMLGEAADYLKENHMEKKQPDWKHGQTINRLLHAMRQMDIASLEQVYNAIQDAKTPRDNTIKNIFLSMVPNVGTLNTSMFILNMIRKHKVSDLSAVMMLTKLPMYVKVPSERTLLEMEDLVKLGDSVSFEVKKASILCFATMIHKTFKNERPETPSPLLERYVHHFMDHVKNEPTYQMKMVYLMAIKNIGVHSIVKHLEPIVRGDLVISDKPHHIRVQAILAIKQVVVKDLQYAHDLFWPVLADTTLPLPVRIAAYEVLMSQLPHMGRMMNIYWFMVYEKNEHLYNYHLTTLQGLANCVDPCMQPVREMAMKILRFTRIRPVTGVLSSMYHIDFTDETYGMGQSLKASMIVDPLTGLPYTGYVQHSKTDARRPVTGLGIHWSIYGLDEIVEEVTRELFGGAKEEVINVNVKNILMRAAQDMPQKKDIHVDIGITMNDHVVIANHYDKDTWTKLFDDLKQWKRHVTDIDVNWQYVAYDNLFEMQVPTDLGVPAVLATRMPTVTSLKMKTVLSETKVPLSLKIEADGRIWGHGEYVMSIYNPIADVWHSIRKSTTLDVALPVEMSIGFNQETNSLKITLPRLPVTKLSVAGIVTHAKNYVTIVDDETDVLKKTCPTCHHHEVVTDGAVQKKAYQNVSDSKDTGLQYFMGIFDCEGEMTPISQMAKWYTAVILKATDTIGKVKSPEYGNCGVLLKMEPSVVYPTSRIDVNMRMNVEDLDHIHDALHVLSSKKINVRGTVDVKAASTNTTVRSWDMNLNVDLSQGHVNNIMKLQITRVTPGEKNLKICVDAQMNYPVITMDPLKLGTTKEETNLKTTFTMGETDEDKCVRDDTVVTMTVKGEMTEDQKKHMLHDSVHGTCIKHIQDPKMQTQAGHVPKTWECFRETILHTTLRKYTMNMAYKKVPQVVVSAATLMQDLMRSDLFPHVKYTTTHVDSGNIYSVLELPFGGALGNLMLDNTRFSMLRLYKLMNENTKMCTMYPRVLLTLDNGTIPFMVPDQWTLMSGDHVHKTFAVFVKTIEGNRMAVKVYVGGQELEMTPVDSTTMVKLNGNVLDHPEKGVMVPADEPDSYAIKMTHNYQHMIVQSQRVPLILMCTPNSVTVLLDTTLQGHITGMCGHMDGTHKETIPQIYSAAHL